MAGASKAIDLLEDAVKVGCLTVAGIVVSSSALAGAGLIAAGPLLDFKKNASGPAKRAVNQAMKNALKSAKGELMIAYGVSDGPDYAALIERDDAHRAVITHLRAALPSRDAMVANAFVAADLAPLMANELSERDPDRLPLAETAAPNAIALTYAHTVLDALCAQKALLEDAHAEIARATLERVNQLMDEVKRLRSATVDFSTAQALARRLPEDTGDLDAQVRELLRQLDAADDLIAEGAAPSNLDAFVQAVRERVATKIKQQDFDGALDEATDSFDQWARQEADRQEAEIRNGLALLETTISAAIAKGDAEAVAQAELRRVDLDAKRAEPELSLEGVLKTYRDQALSHGAPIDHETAIVLARALLDRATSPSQRGAANNSLGITLQEFGERENGTARLEEAVTAYHAALAEHTRDRVPLNWAMTQNNLGIALWRLGARESGTARLEEAVTAYHAALAEHTRDRVPLDWAMTQNNLGNALLSLGERESGTARLEEAVAVYRAALEERTRDRVPPDWAMTQNNLGNALTALGERESGTAHLQEAVTIYRGALVERTRDRVPLDWAMTQNNLGTALETLGERESGTARLEEAVTAYRAALEVYETPGASHYIGVAQGNLARAEALLAERRASGD